MVDRLRTPGGYPAEHCGGLMPLGNASHWTAGIPAVTSEEAYCRLGREVSWHDPGSPFGCRRPTFIGDTR